MSQSGKSTRSGNKTTCSKTTESLLIVTDSTNAVLEKNTKRLCDSQTDADIEEAMGEGGVRDSSVVWDLFRLT
jgi:hypothetical protein